MKLTTKISNAYSSRLLTLFFLTVALGEVLYLRTLSRDLQIKTDGAITLLEPGKDAHVVRISQTFGNSADELCPFLGTVKGNQLRFKDCSDKGWDGCASIGMQLS